MFCIGIGKIFLLVFLLAQVFANEIAQVLVKLIREKSELNYVFVNNLKSDIANDQFNSIMQTLRVEAHCTAVQHYAKHRRFIGGQVDIKILFIEEANDVYAIEELPLNGELTHPQLERRHLIVWLQQNGDAAGAGAGVTRVQLQQIFAHYLHTHYQIDVTVLLLLLQHLPTEESHASLYTFLPYERNACLSTQPVRISMELALRNPEQLFPKKLLQFHGCSLSVIVHNYLPALDVDWTTKTLKGGFDAALIQLLANRLEFNLELHPNEPPDKMYGEVYPNGSMTGVFPILNERRANFSLGLYFSPIRWQQFGTTHSYFYTNIMFITHSGRHYTPGELLLLPFDLAIWLLLLLFTIIQLIFHYDLLRFSKIQPLRRFYLTFWLLACIVLRSAYEATEFQFVQRQAHHPMPDSLAQLQQQGFHLYTDAGNQVDLNAIDDNFYDGKLAKQPLNFLMEMLSKRHKYEKAVVLSPCQIITIYFRKYREQTVRMNILTENYKFVPACIYFPPFSYLANAFNPLLLRFVEVGLLLKPSKATIESEELFCTVPIQRFQKWSHRHRKIAPVSFEFIKSIICYVASFYFVATLVFFIELYMFVPSEQ